MNVSVGKTPLVELKNGRIVFKQKGISLDKMSETLQEIVRFREMLSQSNEPISQVPQEHLSLIGKLSYESDKTLYVLSKSIRSQLLPEPLETDGFAANQSDTRLPLSAVEKAVLSIAERVNYGLEQGQYGLARLPAALCLWRWEIKDLSILPNQVKEKAESRRSDRVAAKMELRSILDLLPENERAAALGIKSGAGGEKGSMVTSTPFNQPQKSTSPGVQANPTANPPAQSTETGKDVVKTAAKSQKLIQEEASTKKSAAAFAKFFTKRKPPKPETIKASGSGEASTSSSSDFERVFHPFVVKKNMQIAAPNWFSKRKGELVVIDLEESPKRAPRLPRDCLRQSLHAMPPALVPPPRSNRQPSGFKSYTTFSVRAIMAKLTDAEVCGDEEQVLRLMEQLKNRRRFPVKTFTFADDVRPGYTGTWTRSSGTVGPRTPFAKDLIAFDYSCDSGEEWEEEEEGEEVMSGNESKDGNDSDDDSLDGWLIGDDEDVGGEPIDVDLEMEEFPPPVRKRKPSPTAEQVQAKEKKRKVVQPLVPFIRGPCWEKSIGQCGWDGFYPYKMQFFNDCPEAIDPFTYVSKVVDSKAASHRPCEANQPGPVSVCEISNAPIAVSSATETQWKVPAQPSTKIIIFPDEHFPALLQGIQKCKTASLNVLVDTLYQELKKEKVKKNSIERKVREVAEKRLDVDVGMKVWTVKMEFLQPSILV